ncbi:hypothetical protein ACFPM2_31290 [Azospirillum picis]|nr:hypothetical protein [Azospirillum picis]
MFDGNRQGHQWSGRGHDQHGHGDLGNGGWGHGGQGHGGQGHGGWGNGGWGNGGWGNGGWGNGGWGNGGWGNGGWGHGNGHGPHPGNGQDPGTGGPGGGDAYDGLYVVDVQGVIDLPVPFLDEDVQSGDPFRMTVAMTFDDPVVGTDDATYQRYFNDQPNSFLLSVQVGDSEIEHVVQASVQPDDGTILVVGDDTLYREFLEIPEPPRTPADLLSVIAPGTSTDPANGQQVWLRTQISLTDPGGTMVDGFDLEEETTFIPPPGGEMVANFSRFREGPVNFDANLYGIVTSASLNVIDPADVFSAESLAAIGYPLQTGGGEGCLAMS